MVYMYVDIRTRGCLCPSGVWITTCMMYEVYAHIHLAIRLQTGVRKHVCTRHSLSTSMPVFVLLG